MTPSEPNKETKNMIYGKNSMGLMKKIKKNLFKVIKILTLKGVALKDIGFN